MQVSTTLFSGIALFKGLNSGDEKGRKYSEYLTHFFFQLTC